MIYHFILQLVLLDGFLNRDKRIEPLSAAQKDLLNSSFQHTGVGLAITSVLARYMFKNGWTMRMMMVNPLVFVGYVNKSTGNHPAAGSKTDDDDRMYKELDSWAR
jgi:hypothetical protein